MNAATHVFELSQEQIDRYRALLNFAVASEDKELADLCREAFKGIKTAQKACDKEARKAAPRPFEIYVHSKYGASKGRPSKLVNPIGQYLCLAKVDLDQGGYDKGGAYWGHGYPLYCCWGKVFVDYIRASNRQSAKKFILKKFPNAVFLRP